MMDSPQPDPSRVFVVVPSRNGLAHLRYSLQSLANTDYRGCRVVWTDNGSTDGSEEFVRTRFPGFIRIKTPRDRGFAGTVNAGIKHALARGAEYIAIYSNDVQVLPGWLDHSVRLLTSRPHAGAVGFREILKEQEDVFFATDSGQEFSVRTASGIPGCLFVCPAETFREVGLLDEGYYMYGEDNDFFFRVRKAGRPLLQSDFPVWHYGEGSSRDKPFWTTWLAYRNALRFALKNESPLGLARILLSVLNQGCNPFLGQDPTSPNSNRLRRYPIPVNLALIGGSAAWNLAHLPQTLAARLREGASGSDGLDAGGDLGLVE